MFEEKAEEIMRQNGCRTHSGNFIQVDKVCELIQKGIEYGYNKANEWHYVKDEKDLPTDKKEYLLLLGRGIKTFGFYNGRFWESRKGNFSWQEVKAYFFISVPELKESE